MCLTSKQGFFASRDQKSCSAIWNSLSVITFSSTRKYSWIKDASVEEQDDCFKETVIRFVSLLTWMRERREEPKFQWESQKHNIPKLHYTKRLTYINYVRADRLSNLVNFRKTKSSVISSLHEKRWWISDFYWSYNALHPNKIDNYEGSRFTARSIYPVSWRKTSQTPEVANEDTTFNYITNIPLHKKIHAVVSGSGITRK